MNETYDQLLERVFATVPDNVLSRKRFVMPTVESMVQGKRTIFSNAYTIAQKLHRPIEDLAKFLGRSLATAYFINENKNIVFNGKFGQHTINELVKLFAKQYVLCPTCGEPDTELRKEGSAWWLMCGACGARNPVKPV
ncbi:MAG: translation initiation factor IF-2 subunit beta [Candidatus Korarchaeota archaeon]